MDVYCQHCDEPYDVYSAHHELGDDNLDSMQAKNDFISGKGCPSCNWGKKGDSTNSFKSEAMSAMSDILGDDIDGMASMLDDYEYMFGLD
jgi:type II secretory ATPase GspE/PulE/Tfp pilus assembly ATPase PilB-like protein